MTTTALVDLDARAFHELHSGPLFRFLLRLTLGERQSAEDLLQETLLRAWRNSRDLPDDAESLRRWLFTVGRRVAIDAARMRKARPAEVAITEFTRMPATSDPAERVVTVTAVRDALAALDPRHRAVLIELYYRQSTVIEAAAKLGIPEGTVRSRAHYALRALRSALGPAMGS